MEIYIHVINAIMKHKFTGKNRLMGVVEIPKKLRKKNGYDSGVIVQKCVEILFLKSTFTFLKKNCLIR